MNERTVRINNFTAAAPPKTPAKYSAKQELVAHSCSPLPALRRSLVECLGVLACR